MWTVVGIIKEQWARGQGVRRRVRGNEATGVRGWDGVK
jgi:hypothetical protein